MKKILVPILFCLVITVSATAAALISDSSALQTRLVRLHVVANSDSQQDQDIKLKVRDAVLGSIRQGMESAADAQEAREYLIKQIPKIEEAANRCLKALGCQDTVSVSLCREAFDKRIYDTFSLPAGFYQALRVTIGEGKGHNWWCVAFPELCLPAVSRDVEAVAADAGLSQGLARTITGKYELRFYLLDLLGKWQTGR